MPSQTFSHRALSTAPAHEVWAGMDDVETWKEIPGVDRIVASETDESGHLESFTFEATIGGRAYRGQARRRDRVEGEHISWDIISPDISGAIAVDLESTDAGTAITVALTLTVEGFLASMFFPVITQALGRGFPEAVTEFAAGFSTHPHSQP